MCNKTVMVKRPVTQFPVMSFCYIIQATKSSYYSISQLRKLFSHNKTSQFRIIILPLYVIPRSNSTKMSPISGNQHQLHSLASTLGNICNIVHRYTLLSKYTIFLLLKVVVLTTKGIIQLINTCCSHTNYSCSHIPAIK